MLQRTVSSVITRAGPGSAANHGLLTSASTTGRTASWKLREAAPPQRQSLSFDQPRCTALRLSCGRTAMHQAGGSRPSAVLLTLRVMFGRSGSATNAVSTSLQI